MVRALCALTLEPVPRAHACVCVCHAQVQEVVAAADGATQQVTSSSQATKK
jgi:hypothetical protein